MEEYIGVIKQWAGHRCPEYFMFCEGQTLPIKGYEALFSIIGTTYGGDINHNFKLPDLRPNQFDWGDKIKSIICVNGLYPSFD